MDSIRATFRRLAISEQAPAVASLPVLALTTGALYVVAGTCVMLVLLVDPLGRSRLEVMALPALSALVGAVTVAFGRRFPRPAYHLLVAAGSVVVTIETVMISGSDAATSGLPFYLFVVVDAAIFFPLTGLCFHLGLVMLTTSLVLPRVGVPWQNLVDLNAVCLAVAVVMAAICRAADAAEEDPLTHLLNRRGLDRRLRQALQAAREDGGRLALVLLDLDGFKEINDTQGHQRGDELLRQCARAWRALLPKHVDLARYGGDEFALVVPGGTLGRTADLADRMREAVAPLVCASAGVAAWQPGDSASLLTSRADVALYEAKAAGRDQTAVYGDPGRAASELETAIGRGELVLHYQPLVRLSDREVVGCEALVRWEHPSRGMVPPMEFVPQAEQTGAIGALGRWALDQACRAAVAGARDSVSVNVSVRELRCPEYVDTLRETLERHGLPGARLILEVTEAVYDDEDPQVGATLRDARALGVRIAIDDFGSGYSSLRWLDRLPLDIIKIDGTFVESIREDSLEAPILEAIVGMAGALGVRVVAERVETEHQARVLSGLGCELAQGYLFGRPVPLSGEPATGALAAG